MTIKFSRVFAMSNKFTFDIPPVARLIDEYQFDRPKNTWFDPFCGNNNKAGITNDLNPDSPAIYHKDALDFLKSISGILPLNGFFDPPYSSRQISECYKGVGIPVHQEDTQSRFYSLIRDEFARIVKKDGIVISAAWNSGGIGKKRGFEILEIMLVNHGSWKHDTIVTVEKKL